MRLEKRYGSFDKIIRDIAEENVSTMADVIRETSGERSDLLHFLEVCADDAPVMLKLGALVAPLVSVVLAMVGVDAEQAMQERGNDNSPTRSTPASFADHWQQLYRIGTGWLSWSPSATLNATPAEITEAYKGRVEMLKAIFGTNSEEGKPHESDSLAWQKSCLTKEDGGLSDYRAALAALGVTPGKRASFGGR
jgi:hypothetical protein